MPLSLLILDDDPDICSLYRSAFLEEGFSTSVASNLDQAKMLMRQKVYHGALTDIFLHNQDGVEAMKELIRISPRTHFFSFTGHESINLAVEAMRAGASSFFPKSIGYHKIVEMVKSKLDPGHDLTCEEKSGTFESLNLIGHSSAMKKIFSQINQFKEVDSNLLITGESGTGKEVVARAIHKLSRRSQGPFEAINCGAIPETLLESELFGHRRGSFTDAKTDKIGLFEFCSEGTLLLDEIGDMPLPLQVKLLRVLQEKEVRPLGATRSVPINPRIIACTHRNLGELVKMRRFRQDLLFRLSVLNIH
ncbi:MAG: sigma-54-dependent Fis family transcriptional regulator, partial [Bdellovibrionales bacterium]|nr:sigma-54-dependent Fis family transcriptional regulator [Bdellovibrionales bacterium]